MFQGIWETEIAKLKTGYLPRPNSYCLQANENSGSYFFRTPTSVDSFACHLQECCLVINISNKFSQF